jgi:hypothetical protein
MTVDAVIKQYGIFVSSSTCYSFLGFDVKAYKAHLPVWPWLDFMPRVHGWF